MRIVSVSPFLPWPSAPYAGHQYYWNALRYLGERSELIVVAPCTAVNREILSSYPMSWEVMLAAPLAVQMPLARPLSDLWLQHRGTAVPDLGSVDVGQPDVIEFHWAQAAALAPRTRRHHPQAYIASILHDRYSSTLAWRRTDALSPLRRMHNTVARVTIAAQEAWVSANCDLVAAFKHEDIAFAEPWRAVSGKPDLLVVAPWLEPPVDRSDVDPRMVLFVAAFDRWENAEAARWLLDSVWPIVLERCTEARLVLVGAAPPDWMLARCSPAVEVTGYVETISKYYEKASVVVAPIFAGGGVRFKVAQALLNGIPLVATSEALSGMDGLDRSDLAGVTTDPAAFADAVCRALRAPANAQQAAQRARQWAATQVSFEASMDRLLGHYGGKAVKRRRRGHEEVS